jgi:hypothetical protein
MPPSLRSPRWAPPHRDQAPRVTPAGTSSCEEIERDVRGEKERDENGRERMRKRKGRVK